MRVYLYLKEAIYTFILPSKIAGSFSFDIDPSEEARLINIEARDQKWYLYSTEDVKIGQESVPLLKDHYYTLYRDNQNYLIYVTETFDRTFSSYQYDTDLNLLVGNDQECNVKFNSQCIKGKALQIFIKEGKLFLKTFLNLVYLNGKPCLANEENHILKNGDQLHCYGLRIYIFHNFLLINNPLNQVDIQFSNCRLKAYQLSSQEKPADFEFKDSELYTKEQYFYKSPRIRRLITTKEIDLSPPPKQEGETQLPLLLTIGPMLTFALVSGIRLFDTVSKIISKEVTLQSSLTSLISTVAMLVAMIVWPLLTKLFNKKLKVRRQKELIRKYTTYLDRKRKELEEERKLQKDILTETLISVNDCLNIIQSAKINFWDKRIEQNDFLLVRVGKGDELLNVKVNYPEEGFTMDEDLLRQKADEMVAEFKYIPDVPIGYSFFQSKITAIMGQKDKCYGLIHNILLQLLTFYSYDDIKIVVFTNEENEKEWEYIKYLNHALSNDKTVRFFSTEIENAKSIMDHLNLELQSRVQFVKDGVSLFKPYYILITDDYAQIKRHSFMKSITEMDANVGFSLILLENQMSQLPSKCNDFINLVNTSSEILHNSFEAQEIISFREEINPYIDMMEIAKKVANIPIEFEEGSTQLPDSISFLEMEKVGKVEQLNIMNRWDSNDPTSSLRAEVGVDPDGNLMYLDLHEKFHGPHGLIAGMTGSGKSEFIITYILAMAVNYSPDDVAFILIDYKGGGLAFAFENKATGVSLPHLAGTITNLDKAEMDRTLVSIDSEIKRRQKIFNEARDQLGESTIDIYKYQRFYKEGKLKKPVPHLFIICDEFAELKSQQPDFMDNLISVARIGRSLGVHLILATQKPSGVVNDQIWSNTKFRVCLKVQDASDSKEMLKRPDAASLKQTGRFYLQVGYDEYFALGQSAWCGAKYYPSEKIIKQVDKSINFINNVGNIVKSIQASNNIRIEPQGEQLAAIMKNIIAVSKQTGKKAQRLWLPNIDPIILVDNLEQKYEFTKTPYDLKAVVGEYDAPEKQEQGLLVYSIKEDGNTAIFGNDQMERENLLNAILYSICRRHTAKEVNIYIVDYGSEQLRMFYKFPQIGGMVFVGDDEKFRNVFKLITEEIKNRKKLLVSYGGSIDNYNQKNETKLPQILFVINNYEGVLELYNNIYEDLASLGRDCERYGITLIITCNTPSTLGRRVGQCFNHQYTLHLNDPSDYFGVFNVKCRVKPRDIPGRGLANNDGIHEFQTASIVDEDQNINSYLEKIGEEIRKIDSTTAKPIPSLPEKITLDLIEKEISTLQKVPIGISKNTLHVIKYDFSSSTANSIISNQLKNINSFMDSLLDVFLRIPKLNIFFVDTLNLLPSAASKQFNNRKIIYGNGNFEGMFDYFKQIETDPNNKAKPKLYIFYGLEKLKQKVAVSKIDELFKLIKENENSNIILCDSSKALKALDFDTWYSSVKNNTDGIWVGKGFGEQQNFRISRITKEMTASYPNNYGFCILESSAEVIKILEFNDMLSKKEEDDEE